MEEISNNYEKYENEYAKFQGQYEDYVKLISKVKEAQASCLKQLNHQNKFTKLIQDKIKACPTGDDHDLKTRLESIDSDLSIKSALLKDIGDTLPKSNGFYLGVVVGNVNLSFSTKQEKFAYKHDYELFKVTFAGICAFLALILLNYSLNRIFDTLYFFLLVWYYCTLTIREKILIINGSRIKGWWHVYHFIMTAASALMLIWPESTSYEKFRDTFFTYILYIHLINCLTYQYQKECLYKLRALGMRHSMDITVDGFMSWMFRHLSFMIPFLMTAYAFQFYIAYFLHNLSKEENIQEWHVKGQGIIFLVLASGNLSTIFFVLFQKTIRRNSSITKAYLKRKYSFSLSEQRSDLTRNKSVPIFVTG